MKRTLHCAIGIVFGLTASVCAQSLPTLNEGTHPKPRLDAKQREEVHSMLDTRQTEAKGLGERAKRLTMKIGELAASGKVPQDQEALDQMKKMVDELTEIRAKLTTIEQEVADIRAFVDGARKTLPAVQKDVDSLKRTKWGNYIQFQYRDNDQLNGQTDAFVLRRVRLGVTQTIDPRTSLKVSFDLAQNATGLSNNTAAQLRDAFVRYDMIPNRLNAVGGQFPLPLGYELERSSSEREFPERTIYNNENFAGERGRGVNVNYSLAKGVAANVGVVNALTINDPEQRSVTGSPANRLGVVAGIRAEGPKYRIGLSGIATQRPGYQVGYLAGPPAERVFGTDVDRQFLYLDGAYSGLFDPKLFVRGEVMVGKDRSTLPIAANTTSSGTSNSGEVDHGKIEDAFRQKDRAGYHLLIGYNLDDRNQIALRYEAYDPDLDHAGDFVRGYGLAYNHFINPNARVTFAHEIFEDDRRGPVVSNEPGEIRNLQQKRYGITTLRVQFKF